MNEIACPDLNLIKNLREELDRRIKVRNNHLKSVKELVCLLLAEWEKTATVIQELVKSMPRKVAAEITSRSTNHLM